MITIVPREQQRSGALFGGAILENRPISFPENGRTDAYSSLYYWAHVEAPRDGEFGLHPHEGFEIMTFILKGALEHYDTKTDRWTPLTAGGVQVIQAGSGVQHAERYRSGSEAFQIWFDPDFARSLRREAAYRDYRAESFSELIEAGIPTTVYVGQGGPIKAATEGLSIRRYRLPAGEHDLTLDSANVYSAYVIQGHISIGNEGAGTDAFVIIDGEEAVQLTAREETDLFVVEAPRRPSYTTQAERLGSDDPPGRRSGGLNP